MGNQYSCEPGKHEFAELSRVEVGGYVEPARLFCRNCAWVRDIPAIEWCAQIACSYMVPGVRHEAHADKVA